MPIRTTQQYYLLVQPQDFQKAIFSLVASCKLNGIDPFRYFLNVLSRVSTHPADKIDELLLSEWKKLHVETNANVGGDINKVIKVF